MRPDDLSDPDLDLTSSIDWPTTDGDHPPRDLPARGRPPAGPDHRRRSGRRRAPARLLPRGPAFLRACQMKYVAQLAARRSKDSQP